MNEQLLAVLSRHIGADNGASVAALARAVRGYDAGQACERKIRHAIEELRAEGTTSAPTLQPATTSPKPTTSSTAPAPFSTAAP